LTVKILQNSTPCSYLALLKENITGHATAKPVYKPTRRWPRAILAQKKNVKQFYLIIIKKSNFLRIAAYNCKPNLCSMKKATSAPLCLAVIFLVLPLIYLQAQPAIKQDSFIYRIAGPDTLKAYVFSPAPGNKPRPAILLFHGGAWRLGDASWTFDRAKEFAADGMVAVSIDYRLANNGLSPVDGVEDACAAFEWIRKQAAKFNINTHKIVGYGVSAGGHLVAAAAVLPFVKGKQVTANERPSVLMLYSPALNMAHDGYFDALMKGKGDPASYSPSEFINNTLPPTLIIQGEQDSIVFAADARAFRDKALKAGATCELHIYPGVGHLLTRNIKVQYKDFDSDPAFVADARNKEDNFLRALGYISR